MNKIIIDMSRILKWLALILIFFIVAYEVSFFIYPDVYISYPYYVEIYDNKNNKQLSYTHDQIGEYVSLNNVSNEFIKTLIDIEDKRFYSHHGFDYLRIGKSVINDIKNRSLDEGASTITQQLARTIYLSNSKSFSRKINEAYLARKIEKKYTKDYILELYINSVYFAHNLYGLKQASNYYFNKEPVQLNYQDSCILVGIINAPNIYSPFINYQACIDKMKSIAYILYQDKIINIDEYYSIISSRPNLYGKKAKDELSFPYYYQGIYKELLKNGIDIKKAKEEGLKVYANIDVDIQTKLDEAIKYYRCEDEVAGVVLEVNSGKILAIRGGKDYQDSQFNRIIDAKRAIGSTIKPIIYYLGLNKGLTPLSKFTSEPTTFYLEDGTSYSPKNSSGTYAYRKINMIEATSLSDNIYAVKTALFVGINTIQNFLYSFDIDAEKVNLTSALGNIELTPLKLASIYNCFASEGTYYPPKFVSKVEKHSGEVLLKNNMNGNKKLSKTNSIIINYLLQSPFDNAFTTYATPTMKNYQINYPFCVKTGTTNSSSWTVGFNKKYTVLIYVGNDKNSKLQDGLVGKKIFQKFANSLETENEFYSVPQKTKLIKFHNSIYNLYSKNYLSYRY